MEREQIALALCHFGNYCPDISQFGKGEGGDINEINFKNFLIFLFLCALLMNILSIVQEA